MLILCVGQQVFATQAWRLLKRCMCVKNMMGPDLPSHRRAHHPWRWALASGLVLGGSYTAFVIVFQTFSDALRQSHAETAGVAIGLASIQTALSAFMRSRRLRRGH